MLIIWYIVFIRLILVEKYMSNIAIITCFNNSELANQMRQSALMRGGMDCEFVMIDNTAGRFPSAASAYNYAISHLSNEIEVVILCHQDIIFLDHSVSDIYNLCIENKRTLFGAAGVKNEGHGGEERIISSMAVVQEGWNFKTLEKGTVQEVFTLDECLIAGNRQIFRELTFDEYVCDGWHLYVAEVCMQCHIKHIPVLVYDANIVHLSGGNTDPSFYACEKKLVKKYRGVFPVISYSCGWTYTNPLKYLMLKIYRKIRYRV